MGRLCAAILILLTFPMFSLSSITCFAQQQYELNAGWQCIKASDVNSDGAVISLPNTLLQGFMPATVPGTVLTTLLNDHKIPDPFYGLNNELIPDIYTAGAGEYTYWFVKDFTDSVTLPGGHMWLTFRGINYSALVYLNGHKLNDEPDKGMFLRQSYDITPYLQPDGHNRLAVIVYPPSPPGNPNGGQGGDGTIAHSVTNQYVAGWDWIQPIRDRNTGIWDKVIIKKTGPVIIENTHVITTVPGKRLPGIAQKPAFLKITTEVENASDKDTITGMLEYETNGYKGWQKVTIAPGEMQQLEFPEVVIDSPRLWWPNGYGTQELYDLKVRFINQKKETSDEEFVRFGIRELKAIWNKHTNSRELLVNGQKIFIKGGNRILSDALLRFSDERYDAEIRYHRQMNLNLIRVWGGGITERPEFYNACDKYGIMVLQDFWVSGDCNGAWDDPMKKEDTNARRAYPDDHRLFIRSLEDQIKMLRNHPSLVYWCGGNEIRPPHDILSALRDTLLPELDGTRFFFEFSNDDSMSLNSGDGPYTIQPDTFFWQHRSFPFNSESGSVGIGDSTSIARFIPTQYMEPPYYDTNKHSWIIDTVWKYHKFIGYDSILEKYGHAASLGDFAEKAQLVNYNQYRALIEGASALMWDWYTGTIIWKTQNPWTAMLGQMYDVYLDPNACLWGLHEGSKPLHAMFDPVKKRVIAVNNGFTPATTQHLIASTIGFDGTFTTISDSFIHIGPSKATTYFGIGHNLDAARYTAGCFLELQMIDSADNFVTDRNLYWLPDKNGNFSGLQSMAKAKISVSVSYDTAGKLTAYINNTGGNAMAFFLHLSLIDRNSGERILPIFCENNYFSLNNNIGCAYYIEYPTTFTKPLLVVDGWNVDRTVSTEKTH